MGIQADGIAIALAWPETYCKQPGAWYDPLTNLTGISKHGYYKVGHAAILLIDVTSGGDCHYFDFGRYHSPFGTGRVRSKQTDHELQIDLKAVVDSKGQLTNYSEIVELLANMGACHGTGILHCGMIPVNFEQAYSKAVAMQLNSPIPYGPFIRKGTNCSRFVRSVLRAGVVTPKDRLRLASSSIISPSPISNVRKLKQHKFVSPKTDLNVFDPVKREKHFFNNTLPDPMPFSELPENAQWLSGEGAGSWFVLETDTPLLRIKRYNPEGKLECNTYCIYTQRFNPKSSFKVVYPSDCSQLTIEQQDAVYRFKLQPV